MRRPELSAFGVFHNLAIAKGAQFPRRAQQAIEALRHLADETQGIGIRLGDLTPDRISDALARDVASTALREEAARSFLGGDTFIHCEDALSSIAENMPRAQDAARNNNHSTLRRVDLSRAWFASAFAQLLVSEAWRTAPGMSGEGWRLSDMILACQPELCKASATRSDLEAGVSAGTSDAERTVLEEKRNIAEQDILRSASVAHADADSIQRALRTIGRDAQQIYHAAAAMPIPHTENDPSVIHGLLHHLSARGLYGIRAIAAADQQEELGKLPVTQAMVCHLKQTGLLSSETFHDIELVTGTHLLPSFSQLVNLLMVEGGLWNVHCKGPGVSTSPSTAAGLERGVKDVDSGHGDSLLLPEEHLLDLEGRYRRAKQLAKQSHRKLIGLGGGYEAARAMVRATAEDTSVESAYVVFTQSGLNALGTVEGRRFASESLADTSIKKLIESTLLGEWIVARELEFMTEMKLGPVHELTATTIGYGSSVGPGVTRALLAQGFLRVTVADKDPRRVEQANKDYADDPRVEVRLLQAGDALPQTNYYFSCAGFPGVVGERALRDMPNGAVVVNCASRGEVDLDLLIGALRPPKVASRSEKKKRGTLRARQLDKKKLTDHRTLRLQFSGSEPRQIFVRKMGQPFFDGIKDKDRMLVDVYMAGLFACLTLAAHRLSEDSKREDDRPNNEIRTLPADLQLVILDEVERVYDRGYPEIRNLLSATHKSAAIHLSAPLRSPRDSGFIEKERHSNPARAGGRTPKGGAPNGRGATAREVLRTPRTGIEKSELIEECSSSMSGMKPRRPL